MIMNESQKLSRIAKRRTKRKLETVRKILTLKNALKQAKRRENY